jgi:hypothetical protein
MEKSTMSVAGWMLFALMCLCAASVVGAFLSDEACAQTRAALVKDVENPARTAFLSEVSLVFSAAEAGTFEFFSDEVPNDMRLVIEHVSVKCTASESNPFVSASITVKQRISAASERSLSFEIPLAFQGSSLFGGLHWVGSLMTRIYADRGVSDGRVRANALRANGEGIGNCDFALSGYTVALQ